MKIKCRTALAVVLAVLMAAIAPMQAFAASEAENHLKNTSAEKLEEEVSNKTIGSYTGNAKLYVCDIKIETGANAADVKKSLNDAGYLVYEYDLNDGTEPPKRNNSFYGDIKTWTDYKVPKRYTYIGYKLTTDRRKAITNLHIMDEDGGFEAFSYKSFAENKMPGLQNIIHGMKASCAEMKRQLDAGSYAAKVAKKYLDMFCVPEKSYKTEGPKLGDWLLNTEHTDEEIEDMLLALNTLMINVINSMLALGISDSEIVPKTAVGGQDNYGNVLATYTSYNGITGYTMLTPNNDWLKNAVIAMEQKDEFRVVESNKNDRFFAEQMSTYGAQIAAIKRAFAENTLSDAAVNYLKSEVLEPFQGNLSFRLGTESTTAYDLLTKGSDRMLCLFLAELPDICKANRFIDVLEIAATDFQHRLPVKFTYDKQYDIDWAPDVVAAIDEELMKPAGKAAYDTYNVEIESFVNLFQQFIPDYEKAIADYEKDPDKPILDSKVNTLEKAQKAVRETIENQEEVDPASYIYYVALRDYFARYTVYDGAGEERLPLLDYLIDAVKDAKPTDARVKSLIYPVVKTLGVARNYSVQSMGIFTFLVYSVLGTDEMAGIEAKLTVNRMDLEEVFESKTFSIWVNSNKDLSESENASGIAMTSRRVMDRLNADAYKTAFPKEPSLLEKYEEHLTNIAFVAMGVAASALILYAVVETAVWIGGFAALEGLALLTALFTTACGIVTFISSALLFFGLATLVVVALVAIVFAILYLIELLTPEPPPDYAPIPEIMLDCVEDGNGLVTSVCRYDVVTDTKGKAADINAFVARKWNALYYTKDPTAGSPLTAGPDGNFFSGTKGTNAIPTLAAPLSKFLGSTGYNLNFHCYYDHCSGIFMNYYTEDSLAGITRTSTGCGKYIDAIAIGHSTDDEGTQAYVLRDAGYQVLGQDLSPNCEYNTYIAFHTTNDPSNAITDIRAAYATTEKTIRYGDNEYNNIIMDENMRKVPQLTCEDAESKRKTTGFSYGLYCSKSPAVGDPVLASGLNYTMSLGDVPEDAEVICYFGGVALDFNSWDRQENVATTDKKHSFDKHCYVYFKSERDSTVDYSSNTYLAGMAFFSGSEDLFSSSETSEYCMATYAKNAYGCNLFGENLTPGLFNDNADVTRIGYIGTHNPKRALTDLAVFTGEEKSDSLPQNLFLTSDGYCSCEVFTQGDGSYYGSGGGSDQRLIRFSHTYFTAQASEYGSFTWPYPVRLLPRALYACGPQSDAGPIKLEDVVFSTTSALPPTNSRAKGCDNLKRLTAEGESELLTNEYLGYNWHSVHDLCQYYYDTYDDKGELQTSYDIGLGMNKDTECVSGTEYYGSGSLYIYYRNGTGPRTRGAYVSNVALCGSMTGKTSYNEARYSALSNGVEIVNLDEPITTLGNVYRDLANNRSMIYFDTYQQDAKYKKYDDRCYLVSVTYTDDVAQALGGVRIVKQEYQRRELGKSLKLPLYDPTLKTTIFRQSAVAVTYGKKGMASTDVFDNTGAYAETIIGTTYRGLATYTTHSGTPINRVEVRLARTTASSQTADESALAGNGAAEYYAQLDDTMEPFFIRNDWLGVSAYLCLQRDLDETGKNNESYIMDLEVAEGVSYDGDMLLTAAKLGAKGCPYMIDFDLAEGNLSKNRNTVVTLGAKRTSDPRLALKDIRLSADDLGATYVFNNMKYERVNDKPLLLEGAGKDGVYIYTTDGSDPEMILWSEIEDKEHVDWEHFDWEHLDIKKSQNEDKTFKEQVFAVLAGCSAELNEYVTMLCTDEYTNANDTAKLNWSKEYAITNVGFEPRSDSWMQQFRVDYGLKTKDIYWAGCSFGCDDNLPVPVTDSTKIFAVSTFGNAESLCGLRMTNAGNIPFVRYETPAERAEAELSGSVFTESNVVVIATLSGIFVIGLAAVFILYRKKKKPGKVGKEG